MEQRNLLLNQLIKAGNTSLARRLLKTTLAQVQSRTQRPSSSLLSHTLSQCNPLFKLRSEIKLGSKISHPIPLTPKEQIHHGIHFLLTTIRHTTPIAKHLSYSLTTSNTQVNLLKRAFHKRLETS
jgi:ribosomal protein S7